MTVGGLLDPATTLAVLLGAEDWQLAGMARAPSFRRSSKGIKRYLVDSAGMYIDDDRVLDLFDTKISAEGQLDEITAFLRNSIDEADQRGLPITDVIVHYVGHGMTDDSGNLSLLVRNSKHGREYQTSITAYHLARVLKDFAPMQRRIAILDCCFSEAALTAFASMTAAAKAVVAMAGKPFNDDPRPSVVEARALRDNRGTTKGEIPKYGTLLLCSCPKEDVSIGEPNGDATLFTGAMLKVLNDGVDTIDGHLSLAHLRDHAYNWMRLGKYGHNTPRPILHQPDARFGDLRDTVAFINAARRPNGRDDAQPSYVTVAVPESIPIDSGKVTGEAVVDKDISPEPEAAFLVATERTSAEKPTPASQIATHENFAQIEEDLANKQLFPHSDQLRSEHESKIHFGNEYESQTVKLLVIGLALAIVTGLFSAVSVALLSHPLGELGFELASLEIPYWPAFLPAVLLTLPLIAFVWFSLRQRSPLVYGFLFVGAYAAWFVAVQVGGAMLVNTSGDTLFVSAVASSLLMRMGTGFVAGFLGSFTLGSVLCIAFSAYYVRIFAYLGVVSAGCGITSAVSIGLLANISNIDNLYSCVVVFVPWHIVFLTGLIAVALTDDYVDTYGLHAFKQWIGYSSLACIAVFMTAYYSLYQKPILEIVDPGLSTERETGLLELSVNIVSHGYGDLLCASAFDDGTGSVVRVEPGKARYRFSSLNAPVTAREPSVKIRLTCSNRMGVVVARNAKFDFTNPNSGETAKGEVKATSDQTASGEDKNTYATIQVVNHGHLDYKNVDLYGCNSESLIVATDLGNELKGDYARVRVLFWDLHTLDLYTLRGKVGVILRDRGDMPLAERIAKIISSLPSAPQTISTTISNDLQSPISIAVCK